MSFLPVGVCDHPGGKESRTPLLRKRGFSFCKVKLAELGELVERGKLGG